VQAGSKGTIKVVPPTEKDLITFNEGLVKLAGEMKVANQLVEIAILKREGKPNPHGGFYPEDWFFNGAKPVAEEPAAAPADDGITRVAELGRRTDPVDAFRMTLIAGIKLALGMAPYLREDQQNFPYLYRLGYEFAARIIQATPPSDPLPPLPVSGEAAPTMGASAQAYRDPGETDDIPFAPTINELGV
jgi:hypothetical protein